MCALVALKSDGFAVLSGDDPTACRSMLDGADGGVSVASNVLPSAFRRLCDLARAGRSKDAEALDARLQPVCSFLGVEPNPIPVKAILSRQGIGQGLRLPLLPLSAAHNDAADRIATEVDAIERDCDQNRAA
jgi:4-hydroxy-tetrahydrodipicolinate synthase